MSIYAPNEPLDRKELWKELADGMDRSRQWFLSGDYNMVEAGIARKGGSSRTLEGQEKRAWSRLA